MLPLALIGAFVAAAPLPTKAKPDGDAANWVQRSDFPQSEWSRATLTSFDLTLDSLGKPVSCSITSPSGSVTIDRIVCNSFMQRAHYKPAKDSDGTPLPSVVRDHVNWHPEAIGYNTYSEATPDVIVTSPSIKRKNDIVLVKIVEIIDVDGTVSRCDITKMSRVAGLNQSACDIARRSEISLPVKDASGATVKGVRAFNIAFVHGDDGLIHLR